MGFAGPIKAVSTVQQTFMRQPIQPDGPTIIYPLFCVDCEFDQQGNEVMESTGGGVERIILDAQGRVKEEISENQDGEVVCRTAYTNGPAGKVQSDEYRDGKLFSTSTFAYDGQGNMVESSTYKPDGTLESQTWSRFDEHGHELESISEGPGDMYYDVIKTYNPRTGHLESFTSLNRDGSMRLSFRLDEDAVLSYWQQPGDERTYGSDICFADDNGTEQDCREYNWDGTYATIHYAFTDRTKRNPANVILYDTERQLVMEADYEYELDAYENWMKRTVWVRTRESGERQLLEKDTRTLTYYPVEPAHN
jgi:hypothetical protein